MQSIYHVTHASHVASNFHKRHIRYTMRHPHIDLASVLAQQTPQIDLRLQAYETSTANFLKAVTNYTNRAIAEITKHRNAQDADKRRLTERTQAVETETNQCKLKEIELSASMF